MSDNNEQEKAADVKRLPRKKKKQLATAAKSGKAGGRSGQTGGKSGKTGGKSGKTGG